MRAFVYQKYGPPEVLELKEVEKPTPKANEVLIKIRASTVTSGDCRARSLNVPAGFGLLSRLFLGVFGPRQPILGSELAGIVESVGKDVQRFKVGDEVFAFGDAGMGCHADYRCMPEDGALALKPANLSYEEAAALSFGGTTALHFLRKAEVQPGESVLVNGASGAVGTACVQLARHFGAVVTAPFSRSEVSLTERGRLLLIYASLPDMLRIPWIAMTTKKKVFAGVALGTREETELLAELAKAGEFKPVIDRRYRFEQIVEA